ncbi:phosphonate ABC transporter, permease protein PhnE [uncultured Devosia sp.]|uniref:phosphonate ABC transporter, permease protein PhnE n=1 Tax=uncultured Devosia sp. TaxID=211434 RepID=UPI0035CA1300
MSDTTLTLDQRYPAVFQQSAIRRFAPLVALIAVVLYLAYAAWFFALPSVLSSGRWDRLGDYMQQWIAYDVSADFRLKEPVIAPKYPRNSVLGKDPHPPWLIPHDGGYTVELGGPGQSVSFTKTSATITNGGTSVDIDLSGSEARILTAELPSWLVIKSGEAIADMGFVGDVRVGVERVKFRKRTIGWPNFLFDINSPFFGKTPGEVTSLLVSGPDLVPGTSNVALAWDNIWFNAQWQHGDVWTKLLQTIVMAFAGTLIGAMVSFPLAFFAARNIMPNRPVNQAVKRLFDFFRSVDMLIWALFFTRAFGPGPLAGIGAIALTETGTLGKLYSEGLENIDDKQREGIASTGAGTIATQRYGVLPQVLPVVISQTLYQWESNTRSASIIGAVGAGGIGLKLWESMRTNSNWSNVFYMVLLILAVVFIFDNISNALRSRLIGPRQ